MQMWSPEVLVVGPGGIKAFYILGALRRLEEERKLENINTYFGVSAGSILCYMHILGYTFEEMFNVGMVSNFIDVSKTDLNLEKTIRNQGLISQEKIELLLREKTIEKIGEIPTFERLYQLKKKKLVVVSTRLDRTEPYYFSLEQTPGEEVIRTLMNSIRIPFLFYKNQESFTFVDGAFSDPYPIIKASETNLRCLGVYLDEEDLDVKNSFKDYTASLIVCVIKNLINKDIKFCSSNCKHLKIKVKHTLDTLGLTIDENERRRMYEDGYKQADTSLMDIFADAENPSW